MKNKNSYFLINRLKKNDIGALEEIYKTYYSKLYGFSRKFGSSNLEPDDFVQQTFLKLWEERERLKEDVLLDKQIFVICRNLILNHIKREQKKVSNFNFYTESVDTEVSSEKPSEVEQLSKLHLAINKMPEKRRNIFTLHKIENLTYQEIGAILKISKKTIANHIYLGSEFLKKEFKKK